jgi:putative nucleotidyltransferase with HDIG domain
MPNQWRRHPTAAAVIDVVAVVVPLLAAIAVAVLFASLVPAPQGGFGRLAWWILVAIVAAGALTIGDRFTRRLLPLTSLLRLSMVFPDRAPSRFAVALRAGTVRNLEGRLATLGRDGLDQEPARAAATILTLASAMRRHDRATRGHSERVRAFTDLLAEELELDPDDRDRLRWSALLHDIGKLGISTGVLHKKGQLDAHDWELIHAHPVVGAKVAAPLRDWLGEWADTIEQHHERWDGEGYPHHLAGEQISQGARIVAVADAFEVMTAARSYKRPMDAVAARAELAGCAGSHFDPVVVRAFLNVSLGRINKVLGPVASVGALGATRFLRPPGRRLGAVFTGVRLALILNVCLGISTTAPSGQPDAGADASTLPPHGQPVYDLGSSKGGPASGTAVSAVYTVPAADPTADGAGTTDPAATPAADGATTPLGGTAAAGTSPAAAVPSPGPSPSAASPAPGSPSSAPATADNPSSAGPPTAGDCDGDADGDGPRVQSSLRSGSHDDADEDDDDQGEDSGRHHGDSGVRSGASHTRDGDDD